MDGSELTPNQRKALMLLVPQKWFIPMTYQPWQDGRVYLRDRTADRLFGAGYLQRTTRKHKYADVTVYALKARFAKLVQSVDTAAEKGV